MAVYNGLSISRKLSDIQDKATALKNIDLNLKDLDVIRGLSSTLVVDDIKMLSGLDFDFERYVASLNYETGVYDILITNAYDESSYLNNDVFVNGQFGAASIKYNFYDTDTKTVLSADISTSRISSWSSFASPPTISSPIFYGGEVKVQGPIEFTELILNSTVEPKKFNTEIPTHKILVKIDGVDTWLFAMKGIPLIFRGFFRNLTTSTAAIGVTIYNSSIRPSWVVQVVSTGKESVVSPTLVTVNGVRTSRPTVSDTVAREKDIKFYYAPDYIQTITLVTLGLTEFPAVILPNLTSLVIYNNDLRQMPNLSKFSKLITLSIYNNNLTRANPPAPVLGIAGAVLHFSGTISGTGTETTITGIENTEWMVPGMTLTKLAGTGAGAFGGTATITAINSSTQITISTTSANTAGSLGFTVNKLARIIDIPDTSVLGVGMVLTKTAGAGAFGGTAYIAGIVSGSEVVIRSDSVNTAGVITFDGQLVVDSLSQTITSRIPLKIENITMGNTYSGPYAGDFSIFYMLSALNLDAFSYSNRRLTGNSPKVWTDVLGNGTADRLKTYNINVNLFSTLDQSVMDLKSLENLNINYNRITNDITIASPNLKTFSSAGNGHPLVDVSGKLFLTSYTYTDNGVGAGIAVALATGTIGDVVNTGIVNGIAVNSYTATVTLTGGSTASQLGISEKQVVVILQGPGAVGTNTIITSVGTTSFTIQSATEITAGDITFSTYRSVTNIFNGCVALSTVNISYNAAVWGAMPPFEGCAALSSVNMISTNVFDAVPGQYVLSDTTLDDCRNTLKTFLVTSSQFSLNAQFHQDCFQDMPALDYVQVISNKRGISGPIPSFTTAPKIRYILLYNNNLSGTIDTFDANTKLFYLHLYNNNLEGAVPNILQPTLQHLLLSYNQLTVFNQIDTPNLKRLHLSFNKLSNIPDMSKLTYLEEFLFNNQNIRAVNKTAVTYEPGSFAGLTAIKTLNVSNNNISQAGINSIIKDLGANYAANPRSGVYVNLTGNKPPLLTSEIVLILTNLAAGGWSVQTS